MTHAITFKGMVEACRKAYDEKRLGAQLAEHIHEGRCIYVYPKARDCGCAIGVGLPPEVRERLGAHGGRDSALNAYSLGGMLDYYSGKAVLDVSAISEDQRMMLKLLQSAHDHWLTWSPTPEDNEGDFVKQLEHCEAAI